MKKHQFEVWTESLSEKTQKNATVGRLFVLQNDPKELKKLIQAYLPKWQKKKNNWDTKEIIHGQSAQGPVVILHRKARSGPVSHHGQLEESNYSWFRDTAGTAALHLKSQGVDEIHLHLLASEEESLLGFFVGLDLAGYTYKPGAKNPNFVLKNLRHFKNIIQRAQSLSYGINLGRHLINSPPNVIGPSAFVETAQSALHLFKTVHVEVWKKDRILKENMNLLWAVGKGSEDEPRVLHLKYRPKNESDKKPIALVGKGVTFDTGGYDIKPSSGMRLMKKDMGGAAAVLGVMYWAAKSQYQRPIDVYIGLVENRVSDRSFLPSDVYKSRSGLSVEIHNTDAEGRLVLADLIDYAVTRKGNDEPEIVVNVATLTGAIKVALGAEIGGLFSNADDVAVPLLKAAQKRGDHLWRMPLYSRYANNFSSNFADLVNAVDGFGGAITAALFLEKFVKGKPWAHLDVYSWNDKPTGALSFSGGHAQGVQALAAWLEATQ